MGEYGLGDLIADAHHGIESGHRFLEDHGDARAAQLAHGVVGKLVDCGCCRFRKQNLAGNVAWGGSRRMMASEVMDFPEPDSPTRPRTSPGAMEKLRSRTAASEEAEANALGALSAAWGKAMLRLWTSRSDCTALW